MISRVALAAGLAVTALTPSLALARPARDAHRYSDRLSDPALQAKVSVMAALMSEMLLDMKVGPLARAMGEMGDEEARDIPPDARLRDIAGPGLRDAPAQIAREMPRAMGKMGRTAEALEDMMPEFERMAEQMRRTIEKAERKGY
ncbi:MAG: hypothetical protein ACKOPQ_00660 [Novosphingobium sp.]